MFATPKTRRLHLISAHAYPKEYFFAITNKGIGGLLRRWGEGASLLRGQWRPRDNNDEDEDDGASLPPSSTQHSDDSDGAENDSEEVEAIPSVVPIAVNGDGKAAEVEKMSEDNNVGDDDAVDALTHGVSALGLVPSSVRFGRGGSARGRAGFATRNGRPVARHMGPGHISSHPAHPRSQPPQASATTGEASEDNENENENLVDAEDSDVMEQDVVAVADKPPPASASARGRRGRGRPGIGMGRGTRGRGGFVPPPPRAGFLARGGAHARGIPRGILVNAMRARGRGALK